jgi:hypothetical protein
LANVKKIFSSEISDIINGFWVVTKNVQFYHMFYF